MYNENETVDAEIIEPEIISRNDETTKSAENSETETKRGRPKSSADRKRSRNQARLDLKNALLYAHQGAAVILNDGIWAIADEEANDLAAALERLADEYSIDFTEIGSRYFAVFGLLACCSKIYIPRILFKQQQAQSETQ